MGTEPPKQRKRPSVVGGPRIDRLRYSRFALPLWIAAIGLAFHDRFRPMTLALFATIGLAIVVVWEVLRERMKSERVRRQLMEEIGGFLWRHTKFEYVRHPLIAAATVPGQTVESARKATAVRHLMPDPLVATWAMRAVEADLDVTENVRMYLIHGRAAVDDLNDWERAFSAGEMDSLAAQALLRDYDNRKTHVAQWYAAWLQAQGMDWKAFSARQEATLATPHAPTAPVQPTG